MIDRRPSGASSALATLRAGDRLGDYTIEHLLGVGGTACVYSSTTREGRRIALKVLRDDRADDPDARRRFLQEARVGAGLHHPNIVRFVDFGSRRNQLYLAMELVVGTSLWSWVEHPPSAHHVLDVFDQILDALAHAHARGVVHRDLKPDNILLEQGDGHRLRVRLVDFGVAQHDEDAARTDDTPSVVGTPEYMSPEQCLGSPTVSFASDLYAVGVMLFEILTGYLPFEGSNTAATLVAHLRNPIPPLVPRDRYELEPNLEVVVRRLLAREPADRFLNAAAARTALGSCRIFDRWESATPPPRSNQKGLSRAEPPPVTAGLFLVSDPPFVDVRGELHDLQHRVQAHLQHDPRPMAVLVGGAPGSGRSRLINELAARLHEGGFAQIWHVETIPRERAIDAIRSMVQNHYPLAIMHPDDRAIRLEEQLLHDGFHDRWELDWALKLLLGSEPLDALSDAPIWSLLGRLVAAAGRRQRLVLVVENIDQNDGDLLHHLAALVPPETKQAPVLITDFRSDAETLRPRFAQGLELLRRHAHEIVIERRDLTRLGLRDMQRFLQRAVAVSPSAATLLADRADGNPSFALQMLRSILSRFGEQTLDDPVVLDRALAELPEAIGDMLVDRLETAWLTGLVPAPAFRALESLSYLGVRVPRTYALAMLEAEGVEQPAQLLTEIFSIPALGSMIRELDGELRFEDRLTRAALMIRAEQQGRKEHLHRLCAEIKQRDKRDDAENIAEIAEHCMAAGMFMRARMLFYNAAMTQISSNLLVEALRNIDGSIRTVELDPSPNAEDLADILLVRAELLSQLSRFPEAKKTLDALDRLRVFDSDGPNAQLLRLRAGVAVNVDGDAEGARQLLRDALRLASRKNLLTEILQTHLALAELHIASGALIDAESLLRAALKLDRDQPNPNVHARTIVQLGTIAMLVGAYGEARDMAMQAEALFVSVNNRQGIASSLMLRGRIEHLEGNLHEAWDLLRRAQEDFLNIGDRRSAALSVSELGVVADSLGHAQRARACWEQALSSFERIQELPMIAMCKLRLAALDAHNGHWRSAGEFLLDALVEHPVDPLHEMSWSEAMLRMAKEAIMADRQALAKDLLHRARTRLAAVDNESFIYDRVEEIAHLLYQLDA